MRRCANCQAPLTQRATESNWNYRLRRHCGFVCGRGKGPRGMSLTPEAVREIRRSPKETLYNLAKKFRVSETTISNVKAGRTWAWLED